MKPRSAKPCPGGLRETNEISSTARVGRGTLPGSGRPSPGGGGPSPHLSAADRYTPPPRAADRYTPPLRHHHHLLGPAPLRREGCRAPSPSPVSPSRLPSPVLTTGPASRASSQLSRRAPAGRRRRTPRRRRAAAAVAAAIDHATATAARTPYGHGRGRLPAPGAAGLPAVGGAGRYGTVQHGTVRRGQGLLPAEG